MHRGGAPHHDFSHPTTSSSRGVKNLPGAFGHFTGQAAHPPQAGREVASQSSVEILGEGRPGLGPLARKAGGTPRGAGPLRVRSGVAALLRCVVLKSVTIGRPGEGN